MKAVVLAGGLGSRLAEETTLRPKPMVEIGGKPMLWHLMNIYSCYGFDEFIVGEPGPVVFNNMLYLYFTTVGVDAGLAVGLQTIGVITSADGLVWSAPALAFKPDQTVYPRAMNWVGYSTPNAVVIAGKVHVFVDVANDHGNNTWTQEAIHHAYSSDGLTGWTQDPAPLRRLTDFTWTQREIRSPHALLDGTTLRVYFAEDDLFNTGAWGIGQMTCSLVP